MATGAPLPVRRFSEGSLLRRTQNIVLKPDPEPADDETIVDEAEPPRPLRRGLEPLRPAANLEPTPAPEPEPIRIPGSRDDRRGGMDALRAEALRNVMAQVEDRNFGGLRNTVPRRRIPPTRILLIAVALVAGGIAAFLATGLGEPSPAEVTVAAPETVREVVPEARMRVLVAKATIGVGERLTPETVEWMDWPEGAVRSEFITASARPEAVTDMDGSIARFEFFPGEPIREEKLALPGQGYLSAVLQPGMRGVSVSVSAESASGGFIMPNDHVDVVLTRTFGESRSSETVLHNVRVLAINARLGEAGETGAPEVPDGPRTEVFTMAIATLALDARQAEIIINASNVGTLSLVLRSMVDFGENLPDEQRPTNQQVRISSPFWAAR